MERLFAGIPQHGSELGRRSAPLTLIEFADLQCPFCREYALDVLPALVARYVRDGKGRMVLRDLAFIGPASTKAGRFAAATGRQGRLWQFVELLYRNQGDENSGYVTDHLLCPLARAIPGLAVARAFADRDRAAAGAQLGLGSTQARRYGIDSTPSFLLVRRGGRPEPLRIRALTPHAFAGAIDAALAGR